ncbi:hypothetical protein GobsT_57250 [Gemmata obscuriglobus]|uniref:hypothetical protein n=1 Tax=Gemmata obscuriglobus TaxID=114 RepID=UPI00016C558F
MTEEEWLAWRRPLRLLRYLHKAATHSDRKFRLLGVVCCRRVVEQISDVTLAEVIDGCEQIAEELNAEEWDPVLLDRLSLLRKRLQDSHGCRAEIDREEYEFTFAVEQLTSFPIHPEYCLDSCMSAPCGHDDYDTGQGELLFQVDLLREIFGNPFRPAEFAPEWRTSTAVALAREMYDTRDFSAMPILADALQDAGCDNADILTHCLDPQPVHVRGCWVVDLVLGKG